MNTANYVLNHCPTHALDGITPYQAFFGQKHFVGYLRIFGCIAYAHIPSHMTQKLDNKSQKCIFVGYGEERKAFKLFDPHTKHVFFSRDVIFDESQSWDFGNHASTSSNSPTPIQVPSTILEEEEAQEHLLEEDLEDHHQDLRRSSR